MDVHAVCVDPVIEGNREAAGRGVGAQVADSQAKVLRNGFQLVGIFDMAYGRLHILIEPH